MTTQERTMSNVWDLWKQGFTAWESATAQYMEKLMTNPSVLGPAGAMLTAAMMPERSGQVMVKV